MVRRLEILGEAARRLKEETRAAHPELPWKDVIGQRNVLIHSYDGVDYSIVWETVINDLPQLVTYLEPRLPDWDDA